MPLFRHKKVMRLELLCLITRERISLVGTWIHHLLMTKYSICFAQKANSAFFRDFFDFVQIHATNIGNFFRHFADSFQSPLRGLFFLFLLHLVTHPFRHIANAVPFLGFFMNVKKYMPKILYKNSVFQLTFTKSVAIIHMYI